jgi:hypothetical protein
MCPYLSRSTKYRLQKYILLCPYAVSPHGVMPSLKYPTHSAGNGKEARATNCKILVQTTSADLPEKIIIAGNVKDANSNSDLLTSFFEGNLGYQFGLVLRIEKANSLHESHGRAKGPTLVL